jgi:F-type H+-transporting ATPase subunit epsilon
MADTVQFDLVSPERKLASLVTTEVQIPGAEGDLTAMAGHAPTILSLRPGFVAANGQHFVVTRGFAELSADSVTVLAEMAIPREEATQEIMTEIVGAARAEYEKAHPEQNQEAHNFLTDVITITENLGFHTNL